MWVRVPPSAPFIKGRKVIQKQLNLVQKTETLKALKKENLGDEVGNRKYWVGLILTDGKDWYTQTSFWQDKSDGSASKVQFSVPIKSEPKNVGKSNETTSEDQARSEMASLFKAQQDKGYILESEDFSLVSNATPLPMLAHKYQDKAHTVQFPLFAQPKFDGVRMLSNGKEMWSRKGKPMIEQCVAHLTLDTLGYVIDGELILPQPFTFQDTVKSAKKFRPELSSKLIYRVYDLIAVDKPFKERFEILKKIVKNHNSKMIIVAETRTINNEEEIIAYHEDKVTQGWEGIMLRSGQEGYEVNRRSSQLLKYKAFDDEEFEIIRVETGKGKFEGMASLIMITKDGKEFTATPKGTAEFRQELFNKGSMLIGKKWTVQFFGYTTTSDGTIGVPRFPIAIGERFEA